MIFDIFSIVQQQNELQAGQTISTLFPFTANTLLGSLVVGKSYFLDRSPAELLCVFAINCDGHCVTSNSDLIDTDFDSFDEQTRVYLAWDVSAVDVPLISKWFLSGLHSTLKLNISEPI